MDDVVVEEAEQAAKSAGLVYVQDDQPGYRRQHRRRGFTYLSPSGKTVKDRQLLRRFKSLAIPPAWTKVWISARENGHLQATGYDAKGRKQYRYHADWRQVRDGTKFERLAQFGAALPALRRRLRRLLKLRGLPRDKMLATVIRILDVTGIRIGNEEYVKSNHSFGLATLKDRHFHAHGSRMSLQFRGKGGFRHNIEVDNARLSRIVRRCSELPGERLFQYLDDAGEQHPIDSADVNQAIQAWMGADFTAKDFRTWTGSVHFLRAFCNATAHDSKSKRPPALKSLIQFAAQALGNTPAVCRKHYIHPQLIEQAVSGKLSQWIAGTKNPSGPREMNMTERLLLKLLAPTRSRPRRKRSRPKKSTPRKRPRAVAVAT